MVAHNRRLDYITLEIDGENYECQITNWKINPPTTIGEKKYTFCPDGEFREETDPEDWTLDLTWVTDWRVGGLDRILWAAGTSAPETPLDFTLVNHPTRTGEAVSWDGQFYPRCPPAGGEARATEMTEMSFVGVGDVPVPTYPVVP